MLKTNYNKRHPLQTLSVMLDPKGTRYLRPLFIKYEQISCRNDKIHIELESLQQKQTQIQT